MIGKRWHATILILFLLGCASAAPRNKTASLTEPEIRITQLSSVSEAARHITGGISVQYRVDIANRANAPITIKRIQVVSIGAGAYGVSPTSSPFDARLLPGEATALEFWAPAFISDATIMGANGPVTLSVTVQYDTPSGSQWSIVVQQVNAMPGAG